MPEGHLAYEFARCGGFPQGRGVDGGSAHGQDFSLSILLCLSSGLVLGGLGVEGSEDSAGDVALEAASNFTIGFAFGASFGYVVTGFRVGGHFCYGDHVQCTV